jgi:Holliday junction resolvase RusA-like endonuclease
MSAVVLDLPFPPSANAIWRNVKGRTLKSERYRQWSTVAGRELKAQSPSKVRGPYEIDLTFEVRDARRRDLGNLEKAVSDLLQEHGVIEDDCFAQDIRLRWGAAKGVHVVVREVSPLMTFRSIGEAAQAVVDDLADRGAA